MTRRFVLGLVAALFVMTGAVAEAQDEMSVRMYIVPKIGDGLTPNTAFAPKYIVDLQNAQGQLIRFNARDYGMEPVFLVAAEVTNAQHTALAANVDVVTVPQNLDALINLTALATVQQRLEDLRIPAGWVTTSHTYRDVMRITGRVMQFFGRFQVRHLRTLFEAGITLDTRMNEMTQVQRDRIADVMASFGIDASWVTNTTTLRALLKGIADRLPAFTMLTETF